MEPHPSGAIVALAAGIAGMLSFEGRSSSAVGVAISVTTIPSAATIGVASALGLWGSAAGALAVLAMNVGCIFAAGSATLWFQRRSSLARR